MTIVLTVAFRARLGTVSRQALFCLVVVSLGAVVQLTLQRESPRGTCLACLGRWPLDRLVSGQVGTDVALNVALFVPFGLFATLLWKAPLRVTGVSALISLAIEITQALLGSGANDVADVAANTVGAFLGAGLAIAVLLIRDAIRTGHLDTRRLVTLVLAVVVTVGLALGLSIGGATAIQASGAQQLSTMFAGTTRADYARDEATVTAQLEAFWKANGMPTTDAHSDDSVALARFTWTFYWTTRCVTARWDLSGFTTDQGSGAQCTQQLR